MEHTNSIMQTFIRSFEIKFNTHLFVIIEDRQIMKEKNTVFNGWLFSMTIEISCTTANLIGVI